MSEVDRLSNSGLYPALPIADRRQRRDGQTGTPPQEEQPPSDSADSAATGRHRIPDAVIDEYA
ncbi:MAG: hypothetical protein HKM03_07335 [Steroidobacteraceae bacterium]|nr:hypothetical protein [Steroidobacteraceae bacterium]